MRKRCLSLSSHSKNLKLSDYIELPRDKRIRHVGLVTPCELDESVSAPTQAKRGRRQLLELLGLENDISSWKSHPGQVHLCHLCDHNSHNGWCSNPLHLYIGTARENARDVPFELRSEQGKRNGPLGGQKAVSERLGWFAPGRQSRGGQRGGAIQGKRNYQEKTGLFDPKNTSRVQEGQSKGGRTGGKTATEVRDVSLHDGFVDAPCRVAHHNRAVGAEASYRVRLDLQPLPMLEEFEYILKAPRGDYRKRGKRVPLEVLEQLREEAG
jgi:hypothetical protein